MSSESSSSKENDQLKNGDKKSNRKDSHYNINKRLNTVIDLYTPITICAVIALLIEKYIAPFSEIYSLAMSLIYNDKRSMIKAKSTQYTGLLDSIPSLSMLIIITLCFLGVIIVMTSLLVFLYVKGFKRWLEYFFYIQIFFSLMVTETKILGKTFIYFEILVNDWILTIICVIFSLIGVFSINGFGPLKLRQFFHIILGVNIALLFVSLFPEWVIWSILITISSWDLVAVLWSKGPLNILVNTAQKRNEELFSALVYSCMAHTEIVKSDDNKKIVNNNKKDEDKEKIDNNIKDEDKKMVDNNKKDKDKNETNNKEKVVEDNSEEEENENAKLGMGDFVFYTLLILHVYRYRDPISLVNCFTSILTGLTMTIFILVYFKRALPALPISIFSSIIFFFGTYYLGSPFYQEMSNNNIII
uniref:Presenilin n=1 Tax=Strongyloides venezuelensis TaxID=75913 RepID=A0A0K0G2F6_STRVS